MKYLKIVSGHYTYQKVRNW